MSDDAELWRELVDITWVSLVKPMTPAERHVLLAWMKARQATASDVVEVEHLAEWVIRDSDWSRQLGIDAM